MATTLTSKGQVTIPKPIRDLLQLKPGDRVEFVSNADGEVKLLPMSRSIHELKGLLKAPDKPLSLKEMDEAVAKGAGNQ